MNPYEVLEIKENYQELNEFFCEENNRKIENKYKELKELYNKKISEYMEKYQLLDEDVIGENYSKKVERAFGEMDQENDFEYFNKCVEEIEAAEKEVQKFKKMLIEIEEAYEEIKDPAQRVIEYASNIKQEKSGRVSNNSIKFENEAQSSAFRKMIFDELGFTTLAKDDIPSIFAKIDEHFRSKSKLKGLSKEKREQLKEYLIECLEQKTEMKTIELPNMPEGIKMYIKPADLDIEYTVTPGCIGDSLGVYDLTIVNVDGKEITKRVFTEKNSVLQKMLEKPIYLEKLTKTIFSLENINYALRENNGFLGIPVIRESIFKQNSNDKVQDSYIGYQWDPYMYEAVKEYINRENTFEKESNEQEER